MPVKKNKGEAITSVASGPSNLVVVALIIVSFFAGYLFFKVKNLEQKSQTAQVQPTQEVKPPSSVSLDKVKALFKDGFIRFGDAKRKVLFVEITDPSCPFCHIAAGENPQLSRQVHSRFQYASDGGSYNPPVPQIRKLVEEGKASYVVLYSSGHGNGKLGMQAMYCAFEKGKFWEAHDKLMTNEGYELLNNTVKNDKQNIPQLVSFLSGAIDQDFLTSCLQSGKYEKSLARDEQFAPALGFQGTPHFLVNTTIIGGAQDYSAFESSVKQALGR